MDRILAFILSLVALVTSSIARIPGMPVSQEDIKVKIQQCMTKSDEESRQQCDRLINSIDNFDECIAAGFSPRKNNPEQCELPGGRILTNESGPSSGGSSATLTGQYVCLPHNNSDGPQTLECAYGIKTDDHSFYAVDTSVLQSEIIISLKTGDRIRVQGVLVPIENVSANQWEKYDIRGIIRVNSINKL